MIQRCYLEITNICNLDCAFCAKTKRAKALMSGEQFEQLTDKLQGKIQFLYFHLMGEPCLHPQLADFVERAKEKGFTPVITTNGTRLSQRQDLIAAKAYKIQISLHAHEGNLDEKILMQNTDNVSSENAALDNYIEQVVCFAKAAAQQGSLIILRLWNQGGYESLNDKILQLLAQQLPQPWTERHDGWKLCENIYLEYDRIFQWPDSEREALPDPQFFCYALRNQIGVLVDGSVVPCCLDHEGDIILGNLFEQELEDILASPRARALYEAFSQHRAVEDLCCRCGYAKINKQFRQ
ncbi:MAG: SPASM domain-containing protein [Bacteroidales bacterium]|nr:SPASM domain-containing protein [Bacteroidales bacterium]